MRQRLAHKVEMDPLSLVGLRRVMDRTRGRPEITVAVIDGPVALALPELRGRDIIELDPSIPIACRDSGSRACSHGTLVLGILASDRDSVAPSICPDCHFLLRPIFGERQSESDPIPIATPEEVAMAIMDVVSAGANVINLSAALAHSSARSDTDLDQALNYAAQRGTLVVAAAGNQGEVGSSPITRHPWVIPVVGCDAQGNVMCESNLGISIGRRGLSAPGENIRSTGSNGKSEPFSGTSAAAPFVSGAIALLLSEFLTASPSDVKHAVSRASGRNQRATIVPPLLDAWSAYLSLLVH
jgi:subtilisin family serine protease